GPCPILRRRPACVKDRELGARGEDLVRAERLERGHGLSFVLRDARAAGLLRGQPHARPLVARVAGPLLEIRRASGVLRETAPFLEEPARVDASASLALGARALELRQELRTSGRVAPLAGGVPAPHDVVGRLLLPIARVLLQEGEEAPSVRPLVVIVGKL